VETADVSNLSPSRGAQRAAEPIPQRLALRLQLVAIAGPRPAETFLEVRYKRTDGPGMGQIFHRADRPDSLLDTIIGLGQRTDVYVGAAHRTHRHGGRDAIGAVHCLWADLDGPEAVERLAGFFPWPALADVDGAQPLGS